VYPVNEGPVCRKPQEARAILARGWERRLREASEADVLGCRCVAKMTNIEGKRYGENGEQC